MEFLYSSRCTIAFEKAERKLERIGQAMGTMGAAEMWPRALKLAKNL